MIADDSRTIREVIKLEFQSDPEFTIYEAENGRQALKLFERIKPDIVTLDLEMPVMDGYQACVKIRSRKDKWAETPILFISSVDTFEQRMKGYRIGGNDFIIKPFHEGEVKKTVTSLLSPQNDLENATVMIVDDSISILKYLEVYFKKFNIKTICIDNGKEALFALEESVHKIDLLLTDLNMPGIDGLKLCKMIREKIGDREMPIVFMTSEKEIGGELFEAGATDYIQKPFAEEELMARIKIHLKTINTRRNLYQRVMELKNLNKLLDQRGRELNQAQKKLMQKQEEIESDLTIAGELQKQITRDFKLPDFLKMSVKYIPQSYVSGDVYYYRSEKEGNSFKLFVGDATGHGVTAALSTIMANTNLNQNIHKDSLSEILMNLNKMFEDQLPDDRFMSGVLVNISRDGLLTTVNAGHTGILVFKKPDEEPVMINPDGPLLGVFPKEMLNFEEEKFYLKNGDKILIYTDGIIEQKNHKNEMFKLERLIEFVKHKSHLNNDVIMEQLIDNWKQFCNKVPPEDDITILLLEYTG